MHALRREDRKRFVRPALSMKSCAPMSWFVGLQPTVIASCTALPSSPDLTGNARLDSRMICVSALSARASCLLIIILLGPVAAKRQPSGARAPTTRSVARLHVSRCEALDRATASRLSTYKPRRLSGRAHSRHTGLTTLAFCRAARPRSTF